jgi:hypothetical protein
MSHRHSDKFLKKGGKYPTVILTSVQKKEENVPSSFCQVFTKWRKMSHSQSDIVLQKGGKCPTVILTIFHKMEENVLQSFRQVFTKRREMSLFPFLPFLRYGRKIFLKALWEI